MTIPGILPCSFEKQPIASHTIRGDEIETIPGLPFGTDLFAELSQESGSYADLDLGADWGDEVGWAGRATGEVECPLA